MRNNGFFIKGSFFTGCNYWASHAGTAMWSDWKPDIVEKDLKYLSDTGLEVLRIFPLWTDFQPITLLRKFAGDPVELRLGGELPPWTEEGCAGVSHIAAEHFEEFVHIAAEHGFKLIISLLNGWMSGQLFIPPALEGRNIFSDPFAVMWQVRFVKYFVRRFMNEAAIIAWEPGNESNCMARATSREEAWAWTSAIVNAIKSIDNNRPVLSGMHGLTINDKWAIEDQGELTDILTVHPYPLFTPYCDLDPVNTMRPIIHASAEACYYTDISGKPCLTEEFGTLGPMVSSDSIAGDFARASLFSQWAHGCLGGLWWCAFDQAQLSNPPYNWYALERELGLIRTDGSKKPAMEEIDKFSEFIKGLPFESLPERIKDGVCILTCGQDHWKTAFGVFMLAKQAGFDIEFQYSAQPLKKSSMYLLPCISGYRVIDRHRWLELLEKVSEGAVLYISYNDGILSNFNEVTGLEVQTCRKQFANGKISFDGIEDNLVFQLESNWQLKLKAVNARILAADSSGNPVLSCTEYGKGKVFFLSVPLETQLTGKPGVFFEKDAEPYWKIYSYINRNVLSRRAVHCGNPEIGITEHPFNEDDRIVVLVNYSPAPAEALLEINGKWKAAESLYGRQLLQAGSDYVIRLDKNDGAVFRLYGCNEKNKSV